MGGACLGVMLPKTVEDMLSVMLGECGDLKKSLILVCFVPALGTKLSKLDKVFWSCFLELFCEGSWQSALTRWLLRLGGLRQATRGRLLWSGSVEWLLPRMSQFFCEINLRQSSSGWKVVVRMVLSEVCSSLGLEVLGGNSKVCLFSRLAFKAASCRRSRG